MSADISAQTYREDRSHEAVVFGQGQVLRDSDLNEQGDIHRHRTRAVAGAVIGPSGTPVASPGFGVTVSADGTDLLLSTGETWVDGVRVVNEPPWLDATVVAPTRVEVTAPAGDPEPPIAAGTWVQVAVPQGGGETTSTLRVAAAGGTELTLSGTPAGMPAAGAAVRLRRVRSYRAQPHRRVGNPFGGAGALTTGAYVAVLEVWDRHLSRTEDPRLRDEALGDVDTATRLQSVWQLRLLPAGAVGNHSCALPAPAARGMLTASTVGPLPTDDPCELPDEAGYRGLENQLYRVEVHSVTAGQVVLKWQRDNASTASRVTALGVTVQLADMGRDAHRGFESAPLVEVTDDAHELEGRPGDLLSVLATDSARRTVTLAAAPSIVQIGENVRARRWDGSVTVDLTAPDAGDPRLLEHGLQVALTPGELRPGDHWLIPARTATTAGGGGIDWPAGPAGPLPRPPDGVVRRRAALATVDVDNGTFLAAGQPARDCRSMFRPLTDVQPTPGLCTAVAVPGPGWGAVFGDLPAGGGLVCLPAGDYPVTEQVTVEGTGHLTLRGAGAATALSGEVETLLRFQGFASVSIADLSAESTGTAVGGGLAGVLSFSSCTEVRVRNVHVICAGASARTRACLRAIGGDVDVADSAFVVGDRQVGVLLVDGTRSVVRRNTFTPLPGSAVKGVADAGKEMRHVVKARAVNDLRATEATAGRVGAKVGATTWSFVAPQPIAGELQGRLADSYPDRISFHRALGELVAAPWRADPQLPAFSAWVSDLFRSNQPVIGQAVVVARAAREATQVGDVVVAGNRIRDAVQGVHVGASHANQPRYGNPLLLRSVLVEDNDIDVLVPTTGARGRHAIFVGNARRLTITGNAVSYTTKAVDDPIRSDGIRLYGFTGPFLLVRENQVSSFPTAMSLTLLNQSAPARMWAVENNLLLGASTLVGLAGPLQGQVRFRGNRPGPQDS